MGGREGSWYGDCERVGGMKDEERGRKVEREISRGNKKKEGTNMLNGLRGKTRNVNTLNDIHRWDRPRR